MLVGHLPELEGGDRVVRALDLGGEAGEGVRLELDVRVEDEEVGGSAARRVAVVSGAEAEVAVARLDVDPRQTGGQTGFEVAQPGNRVVPARVVPHEEREMRGTGRLAEEAFGEAGKPPPRVVGDDRDVDRERGAHGRTASARPAATGSLAASRRRNSSTAATGEA